MLSSSSQVISFTLLVQVFGFLKTVLIANYFGAGADLDGYYLALVVPSLIVGILAGMLQTGFVPVYMERLADDEDKATQIRKQVFSLLVYVLVPFACVLSILSEPLVNLLLLSGNDAVFKTTLTAMRLLIFLTVLNALIDYAALIFNAHKRFKLASAAPLINISISSLFLVVFHSEGQLALTYGLLLGVGIQLVLILLYLRYLKLPVGLVPTKLDPDMRKILSLSCAILLGVCLANMNLAVDQVMASMVGEGAVSQIGYANRFHNLVVQVVVISVSAVLLTQLTSLAVQKNTDDIKRLFQSLSSLIIFIGIIFSISIYMLGKPLISVLLERGAMTENDVNTIASLWFFYAIGLIPMMWGIALAKFFQATRSPTLITILALMSFLLNVTFNLILIRLYGILGLALSTSLTYLIIAVLYHVFFAHKTQFDFSDLSRKVASVLLATMFLISYKYYFHDVLATYHNIILTLIILVGSAMLLNVKQELIYIRYTYD